MKSMIDLATVTETGRAPLKLVRYTGQCLPIWELQCDCEAVILVEAKPNESLMTAWQEMINRCYDTNHTDYMDIGGRGIRVCEFLRVTPTNLLFLPRGLSDWTEIQRTKNTGHYSCGHCAECLRCGHKRNVHLVKGQTEAADA